MRDLFDVDSEVVNLNSGTMSVTPKSVQDEVIKETHSYNKIPAMSLFQTWGRLWDVQTQLAEFFSADPNHLFLRQNISYALNDILLSIRLPKNSEILTCDLEYGAMVNILKWKAMKEGLTFRSFPLELSEMQLEQNLIDKIETEMGPNTSLLMLSHVMTGNGLKLPIERIGKICRTKGIKFVVDGAHGAGAIDLKFSELMDVDAYGANLHKWMMGPKGTGFGWIHPDLRNSISSCFAGWTTFDTPIPFEGFAGDRFAQQWMMNSTNAYQSIFAVPSILDFWRKNGPEKIRSKQKQLLELTRASVSEGTGWKCLSQFDSSLQGPMVAFELPNSLSDRNFDLMYELHSKHRLVIAMTKINGKYAMRLSPQVYNTDAEIREAAHILSNIR